MVIQNKLKWALYACCVAIGILAAQWINAAPSPPNPVSRIAEFDIFADRSEVSVHSAQAVIYDIRADGDELHFLIGERSLRPASPPTRKVVTTSLDGRIIRQINLSSRFAIDRLAMTPDGTLLALGRDRMDAGSETQWVVGLDDVGQQTVLTSIDTPFQDIAVVRDEIICVSEEGQIASAGAYNGNWTSSAVYGTLGPLSQAKVIGLSDRMLAVVDRTAGSVATVRLSDGNERTTIPDAWPLARSIAFVGLQRQKLAAAGRPSNVPFYAIRNVARANGDSILAQVAAHRIEEGAPVVTLSPNGEVLGTVYLELPVLPDRLSRKRKRPQMLPSYLAATDSAVVLVDSAGFVAVYPHSEF